MPKKEIGAGLTLGPYESLRAILMWADECIKEINEDDDSWKKGVVKIDPPVDNHGLGEILSAFLLFGPLDAISGFPLVSEYLARHGVEMGQREFFGDIIQKDTPFSHYLDSEVETRGFFPSEHIEDVERIVPSVVHAMELAGHVPVTSDIRDELRREAAGGIKSGFTVTRGASMWSSMRCASSILSMIERCVETESALFSRDAAGPVWVNKEGLEEDVQMMRVKWNDMSWLPCPKSFREAISMFNDDQISLARSQLRTWHEQVGLDDSSFSSELIGTIRALVAYCKEKPWAARVTEMTTYAAVESNAAEVMLETDDTGAVDVTKIGACNQWLRELLKAKGKTFWISLGPGFNLEG